MNVLSIAVIVSSSAFYFYGINCLISKQMAAEFIRFGLDKRRRLLTGYLQLLGATGLIFGFFFLPDLVFIASAGLALLMLLGFAIRLKLRDRFLVALPALLFALLNVFICFQYYDRLTLWSN